MEIRELVKGYAVSPQIEPTDVPALAEAGFTTVICNRPDAENPPERSSEVMRKAVEAAGMTYVFNPLTHSALTMDIIDAQRSAIDGSSGPVFAYCASGNRSSVLWALAEAGRRDTGQMIFAAGRWGYDLERLRPEIERLAGR